MVFVARYGLMWQQCGSASGVCATGTWPRSVGRGLGVRNAGATTWLVIATQGNLNVCTAWQHIRREIGDARNSSARQKYIR
jgi:hypothetical protein